LQSELKGELSKALGTVGPISLRLSKAVVVAMIYVMPASGNRVPVLKSCSPVLNDAVSLQNISASRVASVFVWTDGGFVLSM